MSIYTNPPNLAAPSQAGGAVAVKPQPPPYGSGASAPVQTATNPESGVWNAEVAMASPAAHTPVYGGSLNGPTPQVLGVPASSNTAMGGPTYAGLSNANNAGQSQMENGPSFDGVIPLLVLGGLVVAGVYLLTRKG